jgi:4a-hydroxytetrahydrobiopterin dehydratase
VELRDQVISAGDLPGRLAALPGWRGDTSGISRDYPVGWDEAAAMVPEIAALAVELAHRPDLDIRWAALRVFMTTHTAGDVVTELDLAMAARLDAIAAAHGVTGPTQ